MHLSFIDAVKVALFLTLMAMNKSSKVSAECPIPSFSGHTYSVIDVAPRGAIIQVGLHSTSTASSGWSAIVILSSPLEEKLSITSYSSRRTGMSTNKRALTFSNRAYNRDISSKEQYSFTFIVRGRNLLNIASINSAIVGFYDTPIGDGSCFLDINPVNLTTTISTTSSSTVASSPTTISTSTTASTTTSTASTAATTSPGQGTIPSGCEEISYSIDNNGWVEGVFYKFGFRYRTETADWSNWVIKIVFEREVSALETWESETDGPKVGGLVWFLKPLSWNMDINNQHIEGNANAATTGQSAPKARAIICNNGVVPDTSLLPIDGVSSSTTASTTTMSSSSIATTTPPEATGRLPDFSEQTTISFTKSSAEDLSISPYDYNEVLHKSILFYEAQRSGKLPATNRIPWRGDSGLKDGCYGALCIDLTGGWYDAGDFVKFGFPMAYTTTVLAWGMIEFQDAYEDAGEWDNALDMLKWATDYFLKAHVSEHELYVQVGDPGVDHDNWGHPETMTMDRPAFKIDQNHPGTEVAAETAAALAASYIVFLESDPIYAAELLSHALQLYDFADKYRGHYHESIPESDVVQYYKSWSGYEDELMWAAMWLYRATGDSKYLDEARILSPSLNPSEFSWDQKSPGILVLLSDADSSYKNALYQAIENVMNNRPTTPAGLTYFSEWGTNRYAANYALIALMTAKTEGVTDGRGKIYYDYAVRQIHNILGDGDNSRSYVVGFGHDSPSRPHHRASSCRSWTTDPNSRTCDWNDKNAAGPNPQVLYGALVGGPDEAGRYEDDRGDYVKNEVAVDYNAGFQSAVAGLKHFLMKARST